MTAEKPERPTPSIQQIAIFAVLGFLALASYGLARPAVESVFLSSHGKDALPYVWLSVAGVALAVVAFYNRFAAHTHPAKLFGVSAGISALVMVLILGARGVGAPGADFVLYVWKDVYIVVLIEIFWTYANSVFPVRSARWLYGLFLVAGTLGSVSGELSVGWIAENAGTQTAIWCVGGVLLVLAAGSLLLDRSGADGWVASEKAERASIKQSFSILKESRYVVLLLALIITTQLVITLIDYQYNALLETHYPDEDTRTKIGGQVYAAISTTSLVLQLLAGVVLRLFGVPRTLLLVPMLLGVSVVGVLILPGFAIAAVGKASSKVFDYSIFRAAKELLYIPLSPREKTEGKALVDMFGYRFAKGGASLLILGLGLFASSGILTAVSVVCLLLLVVWIGITWRLVAGYSEKAQ